MLTSMNSRPRRSVLVSFPPLSPLLFSSFVYVSFDMNEDLEKEKQAKEELQASLAGLLGLTGGAAGGVRAKLSAGRKASGDAGDKH